MPADRASIHDERRLLGCSLVVGRFLDGRRRGLGVIGLRGHGDHTLDDALGTSLSASFLEYDLGVVSECSGNLVDRNQSSVEQLRSVSGEERVVRRRRKQENAVSGIRLKEPGDENLADEILLERIRSGRTRRVGGFLSSNPVGAARFERCSGRRSLRFLGRFRRSPARLRVATGFGLSARRWRGRNQNEHARDNGPEAAGHESERLHFAKTIDRHQTAQAVPPERIDKMDTSVRFIVPHLIAHPGDNGMVIACPNCKRKYQIDTTRIPVGGTSFTCWSCRATVRVDPLGNTDASSQSSVPPSRPAIPGRDLATADVDPDSDVPPSAMRFFESLAAEATLTRQMSAEENGGAEPEPPRRVTGSIPMDALERLQGDDVLDLPPLEPILDAAAPVGDVIDLELPPLPGQLPDITAPEPPPRQFGSMQTVSFGTPTTDDLAAAAAVVDLPPPRPVPPPISLPPSISVTQPMSAMNVPAFIAEEPANVVQERHDDQALLPTAPFERPSSFEPPPSVSDVDQPETIAGAESPSRVTAAEMAVNQQRAWVAPDVQAPEPRSRFGLLAVAAVLVVAVCLGLAWQFVLKDLIVGRPATTASSGSTPAPAPPTSAPSSEPAAPSPESAMPGPVVDKPADTPAATNAATADVPAKPTSDSGGFTIQIRSSPNETEARQFVDSLKSAGFDAYVMRADLGAKGVWYRVRVGRFQTREEAQREVGKLRSTARAAEAIIQPFAEG